MGRSTPHLSYSTAREASVVRKDRFYNIFDRDLYKKLMHQICRELGEGESTVWLRKQQREKKKAI